MKIMKTKKTYEKPSVKEHELKHHACLLVASNTIPDGMNDEVVDDDDYEKTEGW